jgi:hypothetical protein
MGVSKPQDNSRDLGDSAGYGAGGSTLDYRHVVGEDHPSESRRPKPLDSVMSNRRPPDSGRVVPADADTALLLVAGLFAVSVSVLLWQSFRPYRERARLVESGYERERAARFQV